MYCQYRQYSADKGRIRAGGGKCDFYPESAVLPLHDGAIVKSSTNLTNLSRIVTGIGRTSLPFSSTPVHNSVNTSRIPL